MPQSILIVQSKETYSRCVQILFFSLLCTMKSLISVKWAPFNRMWLAGVRKKKNNKNVFSTFESHRTVWEAIFFIGTLSTFRTFFFLFFHDQSFVTRYKSTLLNLYELTRCLMMQQQIKSSIFFPVQLFVTYFFCLTAHFTWLVSSRRRQLIDQLE